MVDAETRGGHVVVFHVAGYHEMLASLVRKPSDAIARLRARTSGMDRFKSHSMLDNSADLTAWFARTGRCPDCGGEEFIDGPRGGLSRNMKCATAWCGSEYNIARYEGRIFHVDRIDRSVPADVVVVRVPEATPPTIH